MTWAAVAVGVGSAVAGIAGNRSKSRAAGKDRKNQLRMLQQTRADLSPYRQFGGKELNNFQNWLGTPEGQYTDPTTEEVLASPGYDTRLSAVENSAAMRGGLFSGNALRDVGEFGSLEYDRTRDRRIEDYTNEYNRRMGRVNLGYGAAGGSAGLTSAATPGISSTYNRQGEARAGAYDSVGSSLAGAYGDYQGQKMWQQYMGKL